jgi:replicative DNA helicase
VFDDATETINGVLRAVKRGGYRFVVVDYVQLVTSPPDSKDERRELEAVSRGLKRLAMRGCSVLALSAVTRLPADGQKKGARPAYQLRGSERLQHDADVVLTLYRPKDDSQDRVLLYDKLREGESGGQTMLEFSTTYLTFDQVDETAPAWVRGKDG